MIRPGLARITRLLQDRALPWKAVHVAGTNGKGSVCFQLSALLKRVDLRVGRFTSPHIIDRWDCIAINDAPISEAIFNEVETTVKARNSIDAIDASEFEILTATAFEVFTREKVDVAVVECGMGGKEDATNVLRSSQKLVTVITRIGLDHQAFLGDTLAKIANAKAGIMQVGATCVVDGDSDSEAIDQIKNVAESIGVQLRLIPSEEQQSEETVSALTNFRIPNLQDFDLLPSQRQNLRIAFSAFSTIVGKLQLNVGNISKDLQEVAYIRPPGRFQEVDIAPLVRKPKMAILDGAHNVQAFDALVTQIDRRLRVDKDMKTTWVLACSKGKDVTEMFAKIPRTDNVILTQFGPVDGMPWVGSMPVSELKSRMEGNGDRCIHLREHIVDALSLAASLSDPIVIAGSLYLASDLLRLLRDVEK